MSRERRELNVKSDSRSSSAERRRNGFLAKSKVALKRVKRNVSNSLDMSGALSPSIDKTNMYPTGKSVMVSQFEAKGLHDQAAVRKAGIS